MAENIEKCSGVSTINYSSRGGKAKMEIYYKDGKLIKAVIEDVWDRTKYRFYPNAKRLESEFDLVTDPHHVTDTIESEKKVVLEFLSDAADAVKDNNKPEFVKQTIEDIKKQITDLKL